ncbi:HNH endonuclease [Candidatus Pacearchaeota archaeon]|jgi:hypothetical protein|nr:HNH endonuclease [Candidatus Pacearchaeota archaeon]
MQEVYHEVKNSGYEVSNIGNVRRSSVGINTHIGRIKKASISGNGYKIVGLFKNGKRKNVLVHRAVVEAFIGPIPDDMEVNHKDGNKLNNCLENLEIVSRSRNFHHAIEAGLIRSDWHDLPKKRHFGEDHWTHKKPERLARGDNNGSRKRPERLSRGESRWIAKITEEDVREMRSLYELGVHKEILAALYGITRTNVYYIVNFKSWRHVI